MGLSVNDIHKTQKVAADAGIAYTNVNEVFSTSGDNEVITFAEDVDVHAIKVQNESATETVVILKADDVVLDRNAVPSKEEMSYSLASPQRFVSGTVIQVNLGGANQHNCTVVYTPANG